MVLGLVVLSMNTIVSAYMPAESISDYELSDTVLYEDAKDISEPVQQRNRIQNQKRIQDSYDESAIQQSKRKYVTLRGMWGFEGEEETSGYAGGVVYRKGRVGVFRGLWNKTGDDENGRIVGIIKHGYFNGRVITPEGNASHIIGLYSINKEEQILKMRWMTPGANGWAGFSITNPELIDG